MKIMIPAISLLVFASGVFAGSGCMGEKIKDSQEQSAMPKAQTPTENTLQAQKPDNQPAETTSPQEGTEAIRTLQKKLRDKGYYDGPVNGILTPETRRAAKGELRDRL